MTEKEEKTSNLPVQRECRIPGKRAWLIWKSLFEIDEKYEPIKAVGKGAYGIVCSAKDKTTGEKVAIKKIANCFEHIVDARRTLREVMLLRHLKHENVIGVREILRPPNRDFTDLYIVYDLMDTDLHQIIRSKQELTDDHLQYFIYQVLRGLKYVHTANVLHRDLKPSNLLLNATCEVKICDFGLARTSTERNFMTEYVVTRWYRAPELLLSCEHYTAAIDVWSVGCILAELLLRKPIFPGKDYINQLQLIIDVLGSPSDQELTFINNTKAQQYIRTLPHSQRVPFQQMFPGANSKAIDLLGKMLQFDPRNRITVEQALEHPYLSSLHNAAYEPSAPSAFAFTMEDEELDQITLRAKVWDEISIYNPAPRVTADISLGWGRKK